MKNKIECLAKGEFEYALPYLIFSENEILCVLEEGTRYEGSITICNSNGRKMKGVIYTSHPQLVIKEPSFICTEYQMDYYVDAAFLQEGERIEGKIIVVSDCGEYELPFEIRVRAPYYSSSVGEVKDMFQFANLARSDWTEAKKFFRSENFERIILRNELKYKEVYQGLKRSVSSSQALEEFLITIHKKHRVELSVDRMAFDYKDCIGIFADQFTITKNQWGYSQIFLSTDVPFIQLEQKILWSDQFIGNSQSIKFLVNTEHMHPGENFGRIFIKTVYQTLTIEIHCHYGNKRNRAGDRRRKEKQLWYSFTRNYLDFQIGRKELSGYLQELRIMAEQMTRQENHFYRELLRIHHFLLSGNHRMAGRLLEIMEEDEPAVKKSSPVEYAAYLYLNAQYRTSNETVQSAADLLKGIYRQESNDWRILWFLLKADIRYDRNISMKLDEIRKQFDLGRRSPILYYEALLIFMAEPQLLRELGEFEIQVMHFGVKEKFLSKEIVLQYAYLAARKKTYHTIIFTDLEKFYEKYPLTEILTSICSILIKGMKKGQSYFKWFSRGVEEQLRVTELYEYYMASLPEEISEQLPHHVLLYFIYNSSLSERKLALLYANVIRYKDKPKSLYRSYVKKMEVFAAKQLEMGRINRNLAILYREFMGSGNTGSHMTVYLPKVIFTYEFACNNPNIIAVLIRRRETGKEEIHSLVDGKAMIQKFSDATDIYPIDQQGNRYYNSIEYALEPLLPMKENEIAGLKGEEEGYLLHMLNYVQSNRMLHKGAVEIHKKVLQTIDLQDNYRLESLLVLTDYYFDHFEEEPFRFYLSEIDIHATKRTDRHRLMEYETICRNYDKVFHLIQNYGAEGIPIKRLLAFVSGWFVRFGLEQREESMVDICHYIYRRGKYNEKILKYLILHYYGSTERMLRLWKSAMDFEVDTRWLEERLLTQVLFTEHCFKESAEVFLSYYSNITNPKIVRAYLSYQAYRYLVHKEDLQEEILLRMRRELSYEQNDICLIAWLQKNVKRTEFSESEIEFIKVSLKYFEENNISFPFFISYHNRLQPEEWRKQAYDIQYNADPDKIIYIHYRFSGRAGENPYTAEKLTALFGGIHLKRICLFYHEVLEYYFTEQIGEEETKSETFRLVGEMEIKDRTDSKYDMLNQILFARESGNMNQLYELMENYIRIEYVSRKCFTAIERR